MSDAAIAPGARAPEAPRAQLKATARRKIQGFTRLIDDDGNYFTKIYRTASSLSEQVAADYHGRFLIELIQNAHDVHPDIRSDGEIEVLFDSGAGDHGVLYVANRGAPFAIENVEALSDLGLSSKDPGQAIGNKGLGFRSVRHVCDDPEIYSQTPGLEGAEGFEGYCFRFANNDDLAAFILDSRVLELARQDLPAFHVPVWLETQPATVGDFARRGFSTVIALPVRDGTAAKAVLSEIEALRSQRVPMLLFLSRLSRLNVRVLDTGGLEREDLELTRTEYRLAGAPPGTVVADLGSAGRHLIAWREVAEAQMIEAINAGIAAKQLHSHWADWKGKGDVAVAIRMDAASISNSRLYTYLPMGDQAEAPFAGYLHGSFFPTANRKGLDGKVRLNAMLLEAAADLAASTIAWLVSNAARDVLGAEDRARAGVDLLCWRPSKVFTTSADLPLRVARAVAAALNAADFLDAPVMPVLAPADAQGWGIAWRSPRAVRRWVFGGETFSPRVAARHAKSVKAWPLWPALGSRADHLISFVKARSPSYLDTPTPAERATLAAEVAKVLSASKTRSASAWASYYKELSEFVGAGGPALADRLILLGEDAVLHPAMSTTAPPEEVQRAGHSRLRRTGRVAVFAPPARRSEEDGEDQKLSPPKDLAENFAFLWDELDWYGDLADARAFLVKYKLILEFEREAILTQLGRLMRDDRRNQVRAAGLRWAFQIWRPPKSTGRSVSLPANLHLYVPNLAGEFILDKDAVFSSAWPEETAGRLLQRFLDAAPAQTAGLDIVRASQLAKPDHYAFRVGTPAQWVAFLGELGVRQGLQPISEPLSGRHSGSVLLSDAMWTDKGLPPAGVTNWKSVVTAAKPLTAASDYSISGELWWMPGQWDVARFDREALECFAQLVIAWLDGEVPEFLDIKIRHAYFTQSDVRDWPTPLKIFLREARWIPAQEPMVSGAQAVSVRPQDIWIAAKSGDRFPSFLRRPSLPVRLALERASQVHLETVRKHTGLQTMDGPASLLAQAGFLATQFAKPGFDQYYERHLANLYSDTWQRLLENHRHAALPDPMAAPAMVLARRNGSLEPFVLRGEGAMSEIVYVRDIDDNTATSLVEAAGLPLIDIRAGDRGRFGQMLRHFYGKRIRLLSEASRQITVAGEDVEVAGTELIVDWCPRLPLMTAVAMEGMRTFEARNLPADRHAIIDNLRQIRTKRGAPLGFQVDEFGADSLEGGPDALHVVLTDSQPVVVIRSDGAVGWDQLDRGLGALCDALGQPALEQGLRILVRSLLASGADLVEGECDRDLDDLCESLRLRPAARRAVRETLGAGLERFTPWLRALMHLVGGQPALDSFAGMEAEVVQDTVLLRETLTPWLEPMGLDAQKVLNACRMSLSVAEFRETLRLDFEALNHALVASSQAPDTYPDIHARQLANRIKGASMEIYDALRAVFHATLAAGQAAPAYALARAAVDSLAPDPAWLMRWREVPDEVLDRHIDAWLATHGASPYATPHPQLASLEEVRRGNTQVLQAFISLATPLVRAWSIARGRPIPSPWGDADYGASGLRARLDSAGVFDFERLDTSNVFAWMARLELWPDDMRLSLDRSDHDLGDDDVAAARARAEKDAAARRKRDRSIEFNGRPYDPEETDWGALDVELTGALPKSLLRMPVSRAAELAPARAAIAARAEGGGGSASEGIRFSTTRAPSFVPSAKTDMIGRMGELVVWRWLQVQLPKQDIDGAWKSTNAEAFTGRTGNDSLGYDFEISWRGQTWWLEVKASLNDPMMFQLGETEVRAARVAARTRSGLRYWIAYVSNLCNTTQTRVELLPNPLAEEGEAVLHLVGEGLRYTFRRNS